jgi:hypothetical protein
VYGRASMKRQLSPSRRSSAATGVTCVVGGNSETQDRTQNRVERVEHLERGSRPQRKMPPLTPTGS